MENESAIFHILSIISQYMKNFPYINFVQFTEGTVTPTGVKGPGAEHMYSFDYAYKLEAVRNWLFQQTKDTSARQLHEKGMASQDDKQAFAAKNVHPRVLALARLEYFYEKGLGVKQDAAQAIAWYQVAAKDNE